MGLTLFDDVCVLLNNGSPKRIVKTTLGLTGKKRLTELSECTR